MRSPPDSPQDGVPSVALLFLVLVSVIVALLTFISYLVMGFLARSVPRAIGCSLLLSLGSSLPPLLPIGEFGPRYFVRQEVLLGLLANSALYALISAIAGMGATIQRRAARTKASRATTRPASSRRCCASSGGSRVRRRTCA